MGEPSPTAPVTPGLYVDVRGTGPDLVLLHGWGFDHRVWGPFADALAGHFRLHCIDLPGHGGSHATAFVGWEEALAQVARCVPPGATLCGWSMGGLLAMQLALHRPDLAHRLVLIATTPRFARGDTWPSGVPHPRLESFRAAMARDGATTWRGFAARVADGSPDAASQARTLAALCDSGPTPGWASLSRALEALHAADLRAEATRLACPILVVHGQRDSVIRAEAGQWLAEHGGRDAGAAPASLLWLAHAGHAPFLDAPHEVAQAIVDWHG